MEKFKGKRNFEKQDVGERIILKWIFKKWNAEDGLDYSGSE